MRRATRYRSVLLVLCLALLLVCARTAQATPTLQLDLYTGDPDDVQYNKDGPIWTPNTIVTTNEVFKVRALLTLGGNKTEENVFGGSAQSLEDFYLAIALIPKLLDEDPDLDLGSFAINGGDDNSTNGGKDVAVVAGMTWGVPPIEETVASLDGADLPTHGVYDTYFYEYAFKFDRAQKFDAINSQDTPGQELTSNPDGTMYVVEFDLNLSSFTAIEDGAAWGLHFDLYSTRLKEYYENLKKGELGGTDELIDEFAPFSHDAETRPKPEPGPGTIPEPASLAIWSLIAVGAAGLASRRKGRRGRWTKSQRQAILDVVSRSSL